MKQILCNRKIFKSMVSRPPDYLSLRAIAVQAQILLGRKGQGRKERRKGGREEERKEGKEEGREGWTEGGREMPDVHGYL